MYIVQANQVLRGCEDELRRILQEAASAGDYEAVDSLASLARHVRDLAASTDVQPQADIAANQRATSQTTAKVPSHRSPSSRRKPSRKNAYPKFSRRGDWLIKTAWSKKKKREYQHKAPKSAIDALTAALAHAANDGHLIQPTDLMPLHDPSENTEIPAYQVYLALAWLRDVGIVDQNGRQGYAIPDPQELARAAEGAWGMLNVNYEP